MSNPERSLDMLCKGKELSRFEGFLFPYKESGGNGDVHDLTTFHLTESRFLRIVSISSFHRYVFYVDSVSQKQLILNTQMQGSTKSVGRVVLWNLIA